MVQFANQKDNYQLKVKVMRNKFSPLSAENTHLKYPFFYRHLRAIEEDGWDLFSIEMEFSKLCAVSQAWRISHINSDYGVCTIIICSVKAFDIF